MPKMTPEQEAAYALDWDLDRAGLNAAVQLAYDRLRHERQDALTGQRPSSETEVAQFLEAPSGKKGTWLTRLATEPIFVQLGVRVRDGQVYRYPAYGRPVLGALEGARAEMTDATKAQMIRAGLISGAALGALIGPAALLPGVFRKNKAVAFVVFANGTVHERKLDGTTAIRGAQRDAVKFNALAASLSPLETSQPQPLHEISQPYAARSAADRLAEAALLHDNGLLADQEYQAKRVEIIDEI
ncbi:MAG: hypothetical protein M3Y33_02210 [Actinomycetota bacterium]|nr:hypothetical protein [Actinomycetota bacterium]